MSEALEYFEAKGASAYDRVHMTGHNTLCQVEVGSQTLLTKLRRKPCSRPQPALFMLRVQENRITYGQEHPLRSKPMNALNGQVVHNPTGLTCMY